MCLVLWLIFLVIRDVSTSTLLTTCSFGFASRLRYHVSFQVSVCHFCLIGCSQAVPACEGAHSTGTSSGQNFPSLFFFPFFFVFVFFCACFGARGGRPKKKKREKKKASKQASKQANRKTMYFFLKKKIFESFKSKKEGKKEKKKEKKGGGRKEGGRKKKEKRKKKKRKRKRKKRKRLKKNGQKTERRQKGNQPTSPKHLRAHAQIHTHKEFSDIHVVSSNLHLPTITGVCKTKIAPHTPRKQLTAWAWQGAFLVASQKVTSLGRVLTLFFLFLCDVFVGHARTQT